MKRERINLTFSIGHTHIHIYWNIQISYVLPTRKSLLWEKCMFSNFPNSTKFSNIHPTTNIPTGPLDSPAALPRSLIDQTARSDRTQTDLSEGSLPHVRGLDKQLPLKPLENLPPHTSFRNPFETFLALNSSDIITPHKHCDPLKPLENPSPHVHLPQNPLSPLQPSDSIPHKIYTEYITNSIKNQRKNNTQKQCRRGEIGFLPPLPPLT